MRAPQRLRLGALAGGGTRYAAILDGRACSTLHTGDRPLVRLWKGHVIEVDRQGVSCSTASGPLGAVVGWAVTSILLLTPAVLVTAVGARNAVHGRPFWYSRHLDQAAAVVHM
jgi:hypothetical protein